LSLDANTCLYARCRKFSLVKYPRSRRARSIATIGHMSGKHMMNNTTTDHRTAALRHATRRARERFGLRLSEQTVANYALLIWSGKTEKLGIGGGARELHQFTADGRTYLAVFDPRLGRIVTFLARFAEWKGSLTEHGEQLYQNEIIAAELARLPASAFSPLLAGWTQVLMESTALDSGPLEWTETEWTDDDMEQEARE
jgi:hypothetical protein